MIGGAKTRLRKAYVAANLSGLAYPRDRRTFGEAIPTAGRKPGAI
jgi:hypothetical protein